MYMQEEDVNIIPSDGVWAGKKYFGCKPNRGMFVSLQELHPDKRYKVAGNQSSFTCKTTYVYTCEVLQVYV